MLQIGTLLDNKYKILSEVGHGGMSVVYLAINERANKTWAVKEVRKTGVMDFEAVKQGLVVETDMLKRLSHEYLPSIVDVIDTEDSFIIVMDYVEGSSLQHLLNTEGAQPEAKVLKWAKQLCDVLGYLHRQNPPIVYRDMKPANVMLKPNGDITLIDFGTAREFKDRAMVEDTVCLGTRGYAAPEQFGGRGQTDARTDIYCLGATVYHMLTGHSPAEPPYEIKPLSYWIPQYAGSGLEKLILKCTQQDPGQRYQSCAELMYALEHYKDEDDAMRKKRKSRLVMFAAAVAVGIIGVIGALVFNGAKSSASTMSYDYLIDMAESAESFEEAREYYLQALQVQSGDSKVYDSIMDKAQQEIDLSEEGVLSADTFKDLKSLLEGTQSGYGAFIDTLKSEDPETYTKVVFEVGLWYFFMKGNTDQDKATASNYLANIQEQEFSQYLTSEQQQLSELMYKIGNYIGKLGVGGNIQKYGMEDDESGSYKTFFEDITKIAGSDLAASTGKSSYAIKIYEQIANWINNDSNYENFKANGVTDSDMLNTLNTVKEGLNNLDVDDISYDDWENAKATVDDAISYIEMREE